MDVVLRYFDDCPNSKVADQHLQAVLAQAGLGQTAVRYEQVISEEQATAVGFIGSLTILIDGVDPFADPGTAPGLACRVYATPDGLRGTPTVDQLVRAPST